MLSDDLLERIDETIEYVSNASDYTQLDRGLQYTQFWRELGAELMNNGVREPALKNAFRSWQAQSAAVYTVRKIQRWKRKAGAILQCGSPGIALAHYWAVTTLDRSKLTQRIGELNLTELSQVEDGLKAAMDLQ